MNAEKYIEDLKARMLAAEISFGELAREAGIERSYMSRLTNRRVDARLSTVDRIEQAIARILVRRKLRITAGEGLDTL